MRNIKEGDGLVKFKKLGIFSVVVAGAVVLTACGAKDNKAAFIKDNETLSKSSTQKFDMNLEKLKVTASRDKKMYAPIINGYLADFKLSGESVTDGKNSSVNLKFNMLGQSIPIDMILKEKNPYLKLDTLEPILNLYMQTTGASAYYNGLDMTSIKGKYLDINAIAKESGQASKDVTSLTQAQTKKATEQALDVLDKSDFSKDGSAITLTVSGKNIAKVTKAYINALPKEAQASFEDMTKQKDLDKEIADVIKTITITTDSKKKTSHITIAFTGKETDGVGFSGQASLDMTYSDKKVTVKVPANTDVIKSTDELTKMMSQAMQLKTN